MFNLYDLTGGNYQVRRTVTYPEFPQSEIVFNADVQAVNDSEWNTTITIHGTYEGAYRCGGGHRLRGHLDE